MASIQEKLSKRNWKGIENMTSGYDVDPGIAAGIIDEAALEAKKIDLKYLVVSPYNTYSVNEEEIEELCTSIMGIGLLDYLIVECVSPTEYAILSGQKRYLAICRLKKKDPQKFLEIFPNGKIPCKVLNFDQFKIYGLEEAKKLDTDMKRMWVVAAANQQHEKTVGDLMLQVTQLTAVYQELKGKHLLAAGTKQRDFISGNMSLKPRSVQKVLSAKNNLPPDVWEALQGYEGLSSVRMLEAVTKLPPVLQEELASSIRNGENPDMESYLAVFLDEEPQTEQGTKEPQVVASARKRKAATPFFSNMTLDSIQLENMFALQSFNRTAKMLQEATEINGQDYQKLEEIGYKMEKLRRNAEKILKKYQ